MAQLDLATVHEAIAAALGDEPCVISAAGAVSWRETTERTRRLAAVLRAHGLGTRRPDPADWATGQDHIGLYLHNGPEYLEGLLGAHKAALAPFNVNYRYTATELTHLLRDARAAALLYGARFAPVLAAVLPALDRPPLLLQVADGTGTPLLAGALDYEAALAAADPDDGLPDGRPDDRHLVYTGGTTGMPKGVIWRVGDMLAGPSGLRHRDGTPIDDVDDAVARALTIRGRALPAPPLMHGAGSGIALGCWLGGGTVVIQPDPARYDAATLVDACAAHRVTTLAIVGDAFGAPLVAELEARPRALPELRLLVNSGAALRQELKDRLRELLPQLKISDVLGSSETGLHGKRAADGRSFAGKGGAVVLDETRTRVLAPGEEATGWMAQSGPIPLGYLGDPEKTAATFVRIGDRRCSVPGDRARVAADGAIIYLGRDATTINTGGEKVFAEEVEAVVRALPDVADAVVVGRESARWGQEVVALYRPAAGAAPTHEQLAAGCRAALAGYKVPKEFVAVAQVGRHANGKADYAWARRAARPRTMLDLGSPDTYLDGFPHAEFARLRRESPVAWCPEPPGPGFQGGPGFWVVTRHADVAHVSKHPEVFSSAAGGTFVRDMSEVELAESRRAMLNMDAPEHTTHRKIISKAFTPRMVTGMTAAVAAHAQAVVDALGDGGELDFVQRVATDLPIRVLADLLGFPADERHLLYDWTNRMLDPVDHRDHVAAFRELFAYTRRITEQKRARPGDDVWSMIVNAEVDGERLSADALDRFAQLLVIAGNETTRNLLSGFVWVLAQHPDQWELLRADPALLPGAIEEVLRFHPSVTAFRRTAVADHELGGQQIRAGEKVVVSYASANRDDAVFAEPDRFDITRAANPHLSFGIGPHFCLGSAVARLQVRLVLERLVERFPVIEVTAAPQRLASNFLGGITALPVRLAAAVGAAR